MKTSPEKLAYIKLWTLKNAEKVRARQKAYREKNKEKLKEDFRERYAKNNDAIRSRVKEYAIANKEKIKERRAEIYASNPEVVRERVNKYRVANLEKVKKAKAEYRIKNPEKVKALAIVSSHGRRARLKAAAGKLSRDIFQRLVVLQMGRCACCRVALLSAKPHLDHVIPLAAGGSNSDDNVQLLCSDCNLSKGKKDPVQFMQERGFLC